MNNPGKPATQGTQYEEKYNTTCAGHHHTQANTCNANIFLLIRVLIVIQYKTHVNLFLSSIYLHPPIKVTYHHSLKQYSILLPLSSLHQTLYYIIIQQIFGEANLMVEKYNLLSSYPFIYIRLSEWLNLIVLKKILFATIKFVSAHILLYYIHFFYVFH